MLFKKIFTISASIILISIPLKSHAIDKNVGLEDRLSKISTDYRVGEYLSEDDAELIRAYSTLSKPQEEVSSLEKFSALKVMSSQNVSTSSLSSKGVTDFNKKSLNVRVTGTCSFNFSGFTHKYDCGIAGISDKKGVTASIQHEAFGLGFSGGMLKSYSHTAKKSSNSRRNVTVTISDEYSGALAAWMTFKASATSKGHTVSQVKQ